MLSFDDSVPVRSQPRTPVQGRDDHQYSTPAADHAASELSNVGKSSLSSVENITPAANNKLVPAPVCPSLKTSTPTRSNSRLHGTIEATSPTKQSPLRQTVSQSESLADSASPKGSLTAVFSPKDLLQRPIMSLTGDNNMADGPISQNRLSSWHMRRTPALADDGSDDQLTPSDATPTNSRSSHPTNGSPVSPTKVKPASNATGSRFSFFTSSMSAFKSRTVSVASAASLPDDDELINLDIETALFPSGAVAEGEAFSPAAFKNLQMNATGLLRKYQTAYQQRAVAFEELRAEHNTQRDEHREAETRTQHLRMQLEDMARKVSESEVVMQELMHELAKEKKLRLEEQLTRERGSILLDGSSVTEDLGVEEDQRRRNWRKSAGTAKSDMSFDTDEESIEEASVFSRSRSPTIAASISDMSPVDILSPLPLPQLTKQATLQPPRPSRQSQSQPQMTAFQKLFRGISGDSPKDALARRSVDGCRNCQGQDASVAWDTASLLRDENRGLKERVGELEAAVENALDVVQGIGL